MSFPTFAIIIGVSHYQQREIGSLPVAQVDAIHFARAIRNWGVPEENIAIFLNEMAQKKVIDKFFIELAKIHENYKLLFYFCGHGYRSGNDIPQSYLLLHDSRIEKDKCFNAISLDSVLEQIGMLSVQDSYIFIDACSLRVNAIINPRLDEELKGQKKSHKSLFCILSSGIQESYENDETNYGYFTHALLKSLSKMSKMECSPTQLLQDIYQELEMQDLPIPEMYNLGNQSIKLISPFDIPLVYKGYLYRHEAISSIQDTLLQNRGKIVCLIGEKGIGKSVLCQCISSEKFKIIYGDVSSFIDFSNPVDYLATLIQEKVEDFAFDGKSSREFLEHFDQRFPYYLIVLDQLERLNPKQVNKLLEIISQMKLGFVFVSAHPMKNLVSEKFQSLLVEIEISPFSSEEGYNLIELLKSETSEEEKEMIYLTSRGNPLKMKKIIIFTQNSSDGSLEIENDLNDVIEAICSCGLFIDEQLFIKTFNLEEKRVNCLREMGLICSTEQGWVPHEYLIEIAETQKLPFNKEATLNYWFQQVDKLPNNIWAAKHLIISVICSGYEEKAEGYLRNAFQILYQKGKEYFPDLINSAEIFLSLSYVTMTSLFLAEILINWGEFEVSSKLLNKQMKQEELRSYAELLKASSLWKTGYFQECITLCSTIIPHLKIHSQSMMAHFYRGISLFLLGNWNEALLDFTAISENASEESYVGRAQCMIGSILGLRGTDLELGRQFLEKGLHLLLKVEDYSGVWSGWNNLGEIFWKVGEYKLSSFYLEKALDLAITLNDETAELETLRNLLQLHLRTSGPFSKQSMELIMKLDRGNLDKCAKYEQMQMFNTLGTAYFYQKKFKEALSFLRKALAMTVNNAEYHIYTLSNFSLLFKLLSMNEKSELYYQRAIELAKKRENQLAIHQLKNDMSYCSKMI